MHVKNFKKIAAKTNFFFKGYREQSKNTFSTPAVIAPTQGSVGLRYIIYIFRSFIVSVSILSYTWASKGKRSSGDFLEIILEEGKLELKYQALRQGYACAPAQPSVT